ncbi:uncharacterized protein Pyn_23372 [Prunus yedoensis var. nudiflora]|uniref:C3HC-type domain-containing protein n=1 Tax=Prunus yedoensis var. nudiflora TaxID=2094558 RepID=A0A314ZN49_PRUYE|nr:uncharacterized protein Pyn_23372 [Prunus yedoensis var. nudiflora]
MSKILRRGSIPSWTSSFSLPNLRQAPLPVHRVYKHQEAKSEQSIFCIGLVEPKSRSDRVEASRHLSVPPAPAHAPLCRPWDRGDLMRRVATFKSMTWFAKPKVVML